MFHDLPLRAVVAHIETHLDQSLSNEELASLTGYADGYFRRFFLAGTGMPPAQYVRWRRVCHAAFQLRNTTRPVTDIALDCGFTSPDAFSRAFRQLTGQNPTEFRASRRIVKGVILIPGFMAPALIDKEEIPMNEATHSTASPAADGSVMLYGVPKVSYFNMPPELTPFISSLRACLTFSGQAMPYDRLLAASGAAFRLLWNTQSLDGGNVDILAMRPDPFEPIHRAFAAAGRTFRFIPKSEEPGNRDAMIALIREEIDAGRPVIAFGIVGPPEACVLTGYQENGDVVAGWNFFQDFPEWQGSITLHETGCFLRQGWYEHSETLGVMAIGPAGTEPEPLQLLRDTVAFAMTVMNGPAVGERANGAPAFDAWEAMLRDDRLFPQNAPLPMLMERLMVQGDAFTMIAEGRGYAGGWFHAVATETPAYADLLYKAADLCRRIHEQAWGMAETLGGPGMGEEQARNLAIRENRLAIADRVHACRDLDRQLADTLAELASRLQY